MATQAIRFLGPSGITLTLDVFTLASDTAAQSALVCTEATNRKGLYTTANFTDTLAGRHLIVKKNAGLTIGNDFVDLVNANGTYDAEGISNSGIADAVIEAVDADGYDLSEAMRLALAALTGKVTATSTSFVARSADDSKDRITATTTIDGDRTVVTLDATP